MMAGILSVSLIFPIDYHNESRYLENIYFGKGQQIFFAHAQYYCIQ
jgi:hypothetical protein